MSTQHPEYVSKADMVVHYRQTIEEVAQRRGIHKSCLYADNPYPLCGNGSYHARTASNVAAVTCPCCLEKMA